MILCFRMPVSQLRTEDLPANFPMPCRAAISVSWTVSSARAVAQLHHGKAEQVRAIAFQVSRIEGAAHGSGQ